MIKLFSSCSKHVAFSLVEMLMALLVASLLMVALAPVMTKKFNETISIGGGNQFVHEVAYNSPYCPVGAEPKTYEDGTEYCEGEFEVPMGVNKIEVTLVGGGGGGAAAATAGIWEKKEAGTEDFKVPQLANELEVTLVGGGSGGGAGGQKVKVWEQLTGGLTEFEMTEIVKDTYVKLEMCGAGGGRSISDQGKNHTCGGGAGAYVSRGIKLPDTLTNIPVIVGGAGGDAVSSTITANSYGGGGGGSSQAGYGIGADSIGGNGGQGDQGGMSHVTAGKGAKDGGGDGQCADRANPGTGSGGSGGSFVSEKTMLSWKCSGGSGGDIGGGGGGGGGCAAAGGGGAASVFGTVGDDYYTIISGGGGAGSHESTGGGGGGPGGGRGGDSYGLKIYNDVEDRQCGGGNGAVCTGTTTTNGSCTVGSNGGGNKDGDSFKEGISAPSPSAFSDNCGGSKDGAVRITYVDYGPGGGGGGSGQVVPVRPLKVTPDETLTIGVGDGANGGTAGKMLDTGNVQNATQGGAGLAKTTYLSQNNDIVLINVPSDQRASYGAYGGCPSGVVGVNAAPWCSSSGSVLNGSNKYSNIVLLNYSRSFTTSGAYTAGDIQRYGYSTHEAETSGGRGAAVKLFGKYFCEPGYGGKATYTENGETKERPLEGGDATGYGGCGGGGGYAFHNGGKGAPGYARISWNKTYIKDSEDKYEYINGGSGGGGSAGNVFRYSIKVQGGDVLKYKIGKGGMGGYWTSVEKTVDGVTQQVLEEVQPTNGGMTELTTANNEILRAGGGLAGAFPLLSAITVDTYSATATYNKDNLSSGLGAEAPTLCEYINSKGETESFVDKEKLCSRRAGEDGSATGGGKGADAGFGAGTGGAAGATGGKVAANGSPAVGFGAGGGGAGLADLGTVNATDAVTNPTVGGNGGDGKIIFRWK